HRHAGGFGIEYNRSDGHQGSALNGSVQFKGRDISTLCKRSAHGTQPPVDTQQLFTRFRKLAADCYAPHR
ncbi:hypothetical protein, partial [Pseudomonas syringae]|uniref:hypothetical protein n=1 Tax=Pseudomonas syringae TaxID=317 RepID=UPI001C82641C